jgi:hypothetical protein
MEVAYSSEMLLPPYKTTRRQHIPEDTYMITSNLLKIFDSEFMQLQDSNTPTLTDIRERGKNTGKQRNKSLPNKPWGLF